MGTQVFLDETKARSYLVVAACCPDASLTPTRHAIGQLVLPGQRSVHMKQEGERRRRQIVDVVVDLARHGLEAIVLDAGRGPDSEARRRARALHEVVRRTATESPVHLVLDLDATLLAHDARTISDACHELDAQWTTYSHQTLRSQPLLTIPDVIAWCWARGGTWRRQVRPVVAELVRV